jgi:RNase P subunit RPR2
MKKKLSKKKIEEQIKIIFSKNLKPEEIKKLKRLAMSENIKLGKLKRKFCKKCYFLFNSKNSEIRIKKGFKIIRCKNCRNINRWKIR